MSVWWVVVLVVLVMVMVLLVGCVVFVRDGAAGCRGGCGCGGGGGAFCCWLVMVFRWWC